MPLRAASLCFNSHLMVVVVREFVVADRAYVALLPDLPVQQFPHLGR